MPSIWQILVQRRCTDVRSSGQGTKGEDCFANHSDTGSQATAIMPWRPRAGLSNQAVLRYWSQRVESLTGSTSADHQTQKTDRGQVARSEGAPSVSWEFSKTPTFAPNHPSQHQTFSPLIQPKLTIGEVNDPLEPRRPRRSVRVPIPPARMWSSRAASLRRRRTKDAGSSRMS